MKLDMLKNLSVDELNDELKKVLEEKFKLSLQKSTGKMTKNHLLRAARKQIARIKTILNERKG